MKLFGDILALLRVVPAILGAIEKLAEFVKTNNLNNWLGDLSVTIDELGKAKTIEEKRNAAKKLSDLTGRL